MQSLLTQLAGEGDRQLDQRKEELYNVIVGVLRTYPFLCYFQGYHDIAQVFLLVLGQADAQTAVSRLSLLRIRDFMLPTLSGAVAQLQLLPNILRAVDPILERHVSATQPFFALASTLTLYAHDIEDYGDIARLFDFLLATEAAMSLYLFASVRNHAFNHHSLHASCKYIIADRSRSSSAEETSFWLSKQKKQICCTLYCLSYQNRSISKH